MLWILVYAFLYKEGHVLFNDALNTFYLRLYGIRHMVKDHSDSEKGNLNDRVIRKVVTSLDIKCSY